MIRSLARVVAIHIAMALYRTSVRLLRWADVRDSVWEVVSVRRVGDAPRSYGAN